MTVRTILSAIRRHLYNPRRAQPPLADSIGTARWSTMNPDELARRGPQHLGVVVCDPLSDRAAEQLLAHTRRTRS